MSGMTLHVLRYPRLPTFTSSSSYHPYLPVANVGFTGIQMNRVGPS